MSELREFRALELIDLFPGLSLRQLQWWDERRIISPKKAGHCRKYTYKEALMVGLVIELKSKQQTLQKIRKSIRLIDKLLDAKDVNMLMLDSEQQPIIALNVSTLLEKAVDAPQPLVLLSLDSIREKLNRKVKA